ncbi:protein ALP1-like [Alnus glutinosa]|uniref:protein ALP1-like n=1 Tax=Alnus glutinosa TaxID=3517 RepID=UPI002D781640|nr:protein ALP1-like [Alnus glutinosa]
MLYTLFEAVLNSNVSVGRMDGSNIPFDAMDEDSEQEFDDEINLILAVLDISDDDDDGNCKMPARNLPLRGAMYIRCMLNGNPTPFKEMFRMEQPQFITLCTELRERQLMRSTRNVEVEESVAIFLVVIGHNQGQRVASDRFQHSTETINRHIKTVLGAVGHLVRIYIRVRHRTGVAPHVSGDPKYYPWFKDCIGAIDGTHIKAEVPVEHQCLFRGRKNDCTHNVMAICDFAMLFTFVYVGWEGTANDGRVFKDAVTGHYYVADSAYPCTRGFLPPYKGERYHLNTYRNRPLPRGYKELFNFRHSSLRMIIENCFARLKRRWRILNGIPGYLLVRQPSIILACCTLHNFVGVHNPNDQIFSGNDAAEPEMDVDQADMSEHPDDYGNNDEAGPSNSGHYDFSQAASVEMAQFREGIAQAMWDTRHGH